MSKKIVFGNDLAKELKKYGLNKIAEVPTKYKDGITTIYYMYSMVSNIDKLGYKTVYGVLDAVNYGVPQFRERFVLIGSRDNEDIFLPIPTHFQMHQRNTILLLSKT